MKRTTRSSCSRNKESSSSSANLTIPARTGKLPAKRPRLLANGVTNANDASASSSSTQKQSNSNVNDDEDESDVLVNGNRKGKEKDEIDADGLIKDETIGPVRRNKQKLNDSGHLVDHDINSESEDSDGVDSTLSSSAPSTPENMPHLNFPGEESDKESIEEYDSEATEIASSYDSISEQLDEMDDESSNQSTIIMSPLEKEEKEEGKHTEQEELAESANKSTIEQNQDQIETDFTNHNNSTAPVSRFPMIASVMISQHEKQQRKIQKAEPPQPEPEPGQLHLEQRDLEQPEPGQQETGQPEPGQQETGQPEPGQPEPGQPGPEQPLPKPPQAQLSVRDLLNPTEITFMRCGVCLDLFPKLNDLANHMTLSHSNYPTYCLFTRKGTFDSDEQEDKQAEVASIQTIEQPIQPILQPITIPVPTGDHESTAVPVSTVVSHDSTGQNAPNPTPINHNYTTLSVQCRVCPAFMPNEDELAQHMNQSHRLDQFECYVAGCSAVFHSQSDYQSHIDVNSAAHKSYACGVCSSEFTTYHRLAQHYNVTHQFGVFQCECGYMAESRIKMLSHQYMRNRK